VNPLPGPVTASTLFFSAWDIYRARFSILARAALLAMFLPLTWAWGLLLTGLGISGILLLPIAVLLVTALGLIGRWTMRVETDILSGNLTSFRSLRLNLPTRETSPNRAWTLFSLAAIGAFCLAVSTLGPMAPLLALTLLAPIWPLWVLICGSRRRLDRIRSTDPGSELPGSDITYLAAPPPNADVTRPLSSLKTSYPDATVAASAQTNPSGFFWTPENRQALMMDILAGHLNLEDAKKRFGLKTEELKAWMQDFMRQSQAPGVADRDIPPKGDTPA
jgi:hypothetical protein